jgi:hypothetical protein
MTINSYGTIGIHLGRKNEDSTRTASISICPRCHDRTVKMHELLKDGKTDAILEKIMKIIVKYGPLDRL